LGGNGIRVGGLCMKFKLGGAFLAALALVISACGQEKAALENKLGANGSDLNKVATAESPAKGESCDLLGEALAKIRTIWPRIIALPENFGSPIRDGDQLCSTFERR
jgi:hypothetical protein